jgi:serine/threonine-protein kinase
VVLIGTIIALLANPASNDDPNPTDTTTTAPPASSSTPTSTASDRVKLDDTELLGRTKDVVEARLTELGLVLNAKDGTVAPSEDQEGLAYSVNPKGNVKKGETITVSFYSEIPPPPEATKPSAMTSSPANPNGGDTVTFSWTTYAGCPAGHELSSFSVQTNGTFVGDGPTLDKTATSVQIKLLPAGQATTVSYSAICTDLESPTSDPITVTGN